MLLLLGSALSLAFTPHVRPHLSPRLSPRCTAPTSADGDDDNDNQLRQRIEEVLRTEEKRTREQMSQLQARLADVAAGDAEERALYSAGNGTLPVVCLDAMLPRQCMKLDTEDPTFCRLLRDIGLGGLFVVTSLNFRKRRLRRSGVIVRVSLVDAKRPTQQDGSQAERVPTAVSALLIGRRRVRLHGPAEGLRLRVGRFRRGYNDDIISGQSLGWGLESFVDRTPDDGDHGGGGSEAAGGEGAPAPTPTPVPTPSPFTEWGLTGFDVLGDADERALYDSDSACMVGLPDPPAGIKGSDGSGEGSDGAGEGGLEAEAGRLAESLERWLALASDATTYDDVSVVAGARAVHGEPGLRVDPARLLARVIDDLGERPPLSSPTALALWGAALINPLPSLGVATEVRGAVLEAHGAKERVRLVQRAVDRSIANLEGRKPLV